jgi:hypothetical protein
MGIHSLKCGVHHQALSIEQHSSTGKLAVHRLVCAGVCMQGLDKLTGGLVVSDVLLESAVSMREIPACSFIFGSTANRDPHKVTEALSRFLVLLSF